MLLRGLQRHRGCRRGGGCARRGAGSPPLWPQPRLLPELLLGCGGLRSQWGVSMGAAVEGAAEKVAVPAAAVPAAAAAAGPPPSTTAAQALRQSPYEPSTLPCLPGGPLPLLAAAAGASPRQAALSTP